jgi:hypothetical protein
MPIKDDEARRTYFREYMRRVRAEQRAIDYKIGQSNRYNIVVMNAAASINIARQHVGHHGRIDDKMIGWCQRAADAWNELVKDLQTRR